MPLAYIYIYMSYIVYISAVKERDEKESIPGINYFFEKRKTEGIPIFFKRIKTLINSFFSGRKAYIFAIIIFLKKSILNYNVNKNL